MALNLKWFHFRATGRRMPVRGPVGSADLAFSLFYIVSLRRMVFDYIMHHTKRNEQEEH